MSNYANNFPPEMNGYLMYIINIFKALNILIFLVIVNQEDCICQPKLAVNNLLL